MKATPLLLGAPGRGGGGQEPPGGARIGLGGDIATLSLHPFPPHPTGHRLGLWGPARGICWKGCPCSAPSGPDAQVALSSEDCDHDTQTQPSFWKFPQPGPPASGSQCPHPRARHLALTGSPASPFSPGRPGFPRSPWNTKQMRVRGSSPRVSAKLRRGPCLRARSSGTFPTALARLGTCGVSATFPSLTPRQAVGCPAGWKRPPNLSSLPPYAPFLLLRWPPRLAATWAQRRPP